jgi:hypothetical protein
MTARNRQCRLNAASLALRFQCLFFGSSSARIGFKTSMPANDMHRCLGAYLASGPGAPPATCSGYEFWL